MIKDEIDPYWKEVSKWKLYGMQNNDIESEELPESKEKRHKRMYAYKSNDGCVSYFNRFLS